MPGLGIAGSPGSTVIYSKISGLTIDVTEDSKIFTADSYGGDAVSLYGDTRITGKGILSVSGSPHWNAGGCDGIYIKGNLHLDNISISVQGTNGICTSGGSLTINYSDVKCFGTGENGAGYVIEGFDKITLERCSITSPEGFNPDNISGYRSSFSDEELIIHRTTHKVNSSALNVRSGPGTDHERIGGLTQDKEVVVLETQGEWSKIVYGTGFGWAQSKYLESIVPVNPFVDIYETDDYYDAVLWAYYADPQITNGMDETHFGPQLTVTRGQAVTFLWRSMGCPEPTSYNNPFVDVPSTEYYYKPILWAVEKGITKGVDDTHFNPMDTLSTQHIITFIYRTAHPGVDGWNGEAAAWAADENGRPFGIDIAVNNKTDCPRCHIVQFLYVLIDN